MKKYIIFFLTMSVFFAKAQDTLRVNSFKEVCDYATSNLKTKYPNLSFLSNRLISAERNTFDLLQGNFNDSAITFSVYLNIMYDLDLANFNNDLKINLNNLEQQAISLIDEQFVPLSFSFIEFEKFKDSAYLLNYVTFVENKFIDLSPSNFYPFKKDTLFAASTLNYAWNTKNVNFKLNTNLIFSNIPNLAYDSLLIDFDNNEGFISYNSDSVFSVNYLTNGVKNIKVKLVLGDKVFYSTIKFKINSKNNERAAASCDLSVLPPSFGPQTIVTTNSSGQNIYGEYAVWFSDCNNTGKIRKPIILSAGYNVQNFKTFLPGLFNDFVIDLPAPFGDLSIPYAGGWNGSLRGTFYETYNGYYSKRFSANEYEDCDGNADNGNKLLDRLRDEGYDVIILGFNNGSDKTINNAYLCMKLIEIVNQEKFANNSYFENVVGGFSAGALTTRLALALMEYNFKIGIGPNPHTKLWLSFDGEMQGANVPLGFQHLIKFQKMDNNIVPSFNPFNRSIDITNHLITNLVNGTINNNTANEFITFHADAFGLPHPERLALLQIYDNIPLNNSDGYPEFCRRVGISQGSSEGENTPHNNSSIFKSYLGYNPSGTAVSFPSTCGGSYTWQLPNYRKLTDAKWWSSNNNSYIFKGENIIDLSFTYAPMMCIDFPVWGCECWGPATFNLPIIINSRTVNKPSQPANYDDAPASSLSAHLELAQTSAYRLYNTSFAGPQSYFNYDTKNHSFSTVSSGLDLHDPNNNYQINHFLSPYNLGLMKIKDLSNEVNRRYGFPYINFPNNHYSITPFDGIYAVGINNGNFSDGSPKPKNQLHVEDAQNPIGDYLARIEIAPEKLYLSNREIGSIQNGYIAEFDARQKIFVGKIDAYGENIYSVENNENFLTPNDNFKVTNYSTLIVHAGEEIALLPGTEIESGSNLAAFIEPYNCINTLFRVGSISEDETEYEEIISLENRNVIEKANFSTPKIFPNPNNGTFTLEGLNKSKSYILNVFDLSGKLLTSKNFENLNSYNFDNHDLKDGIYFIHLSCNSNVSNFKIIIQN